MADEHWHAGQNETPGVRRNTWFSAMSYLEGEFHHWVRQFGDPSMLDSEYFRALAEVKRARIELFQGARSVKLGDEEFWLRQCDEPCKEDSTV
jgi:hypothetical protein